jgi:hypothetical protein
MRLLNCAACRRKPERQEWPSEFFKAPFVNYECACGNRVPVDWTDHDARAAWNAEQRRIRIAA